MPTPSSPDATHAPPTDGDAEKERREIERGVYERRNFDEKQHRADPGHEENRPDSGAGRRSEPPAPPPERAAGDNEQDASMKAHARAQGGDPEGAAPDQARAQGTLGSINQTEGI